MPFVLAIPIIAVVMKRMFQFSGPVNEVLRWLSLDFLALDWIGSSDVALWTVMILIIWRESALGIILFLARLLSLDESLIEAAKLEGANWWQRARYIILPQMRGVIEFYVVVSVITMLSAVFAYVYVIGGGRGGPGTSTVVVELYIFNALIRTSLPGIASAASVLLFLVSVALIFPLFRARRRADAGGMRRAPIGDDWHEARRTFQARASCCFAAFLALVPTIFMISTALKTDEEYAVDKLGFPDMPVLDNFRAVLVDSPFLWLDGEQPDPGRRRRRAQHHRVLPCRLCDRAHGIQGARHAACDQHIADGGAADRDDRAALRALFAHRPDQHLSGRDPHLCRADHALLGLPADDLLPHGAERDCSNRPAWTAQAISRFW